MEIRLVRRVRGVLGRFGTAFLAVIALSLPCRAAPALAAAGGGCALAQIERGDRIERSLEVMGARRDFIVHVPANLRPGVPVPLLFDFHGFNHSGAGVWKVSAFKAIAEKQGFITVYPTGLPITIQLRGAVRSGPGWQMQDGADNRDLAFTRAMLAEIEAHYCIDRDRVFSTGFSNGAFFSSLLGCAMSDTFAAVAPVGGGPLRSPCRPSRPVPVVIHNGKLDDLIPPDFARRGRDQWIAANACGDPGTPADTPSCQTAPACSPGGAVVYCEGEYAHTWPADATERIWSFFAAHPRQPPAETK